MAFTLADRLGAKSSSCSVPGCTRTWISMASAKGAKLGGRGAASPDDPASSMCDPCREAYAKAEDVERPCDRPGCNGTWTWPVMQQMQAFAGKRPPPAGLCAEDEARLGVARGQDGSVRGARVHAHLAVFAAGAAARGRARGRATTADPALRAVRGRVPQAEGSRRSLRHQRLRQEVELAGAGADRGLRAGAAQRSAASDVRPLQGRLRRDRRS